jgi:hypothetical protein
MINFKDQEGLVFVQRGKNPLYIYMTVLQGMIDKLIEIGRCYGMEMNVEKNKSNENFKTAIPSNNYDRPKTTGECGMF